MPPVAHGELDPPGREFLLLLLSFVAVAVAVPPEQKRAEVDAGDERPRRLGQPLQHGPLLLRPGLAAPRSSSSFDDGGVDGNDAPHKGQLLEGG